jgi:RNA polymerase sigma-70 factor (ECF subfamily)
MRKEESTQPIYEQVDAIYRSESRRVFATLIPLLEDFDLAEQAVQTAFAAVLEQWPREGVPANPRAWLVSTGRFKAIDALRQRARLNSSIMESMGQLEASPGPIEMDKPEIEYVPAAADLYSAVTRHCRRTRRWR